MVLDRREMMIGSAGLGAGLATAAGPRAALAQGGNADAGTLSVTDFGVRPNARSDQTKALQTAINTAAKNGAILHVPGGTYRTGMLILKSNTVLSGVPGQSILKHQGDGVLLAAKLAQNIHLSGLVLEGKTAQGGNEYDSALLSAVKIKSLTVTRCKITGGIANGISLNKCSGQIADNEITKAYQTGLFCNNSLGLDISHNHVHDCGNNGIQIWRSSPGEDGTIVAHNRIDDIRSEAGGSGENGNGINVFRAGSVHVTGNRITDCSFTAIRGNAASNFQVTGNSCARLGEVAIYAEFGFEGVVITNNLVDKAAMGISVTNFNEGGRMAVVQGNLVRNLFLRKGDRGVGIAVEADSMVSGNVIEGAPAAGIQIGWGKHLRDISVTGNLIREAGIGIGVSSAPGAGYAFITNNMISKTKEGGIRAMDHDKPLGPDLAKSSSESYRNIAVFGNVSL
jgi:uncharacterized secreted repeat protein (TIGR03808 family)